VEHANKRLANMTKVTTEQNTSGQQYSNMMAIVSDLSTDDKLNVLTGLVNEGTVEIQVFRKSLKHKTRKALITYNSKHILKTDLTDLFPWNIYDTVVAAHEAGNEIIIGEFPHINVLEELTELYNDYNRHVLDINEEIV